MSRNPFSIVTVTVTVTLAYADGSYGVQPPPHGIFVFLFCVCKIYCPSAAPILIQSQIFYRKTLKIVH